MHDRPLSSVIAIRRKSRERFLNLLIVDGRIAPSASLPEVSAIARDSTSTWRSPPIRLWLLDSSSTDAVLLDLRCRAQAAEALHKIKKHRADALVIVFTAMARGVGGAGHERWRLRLLTKPLSMEELRLRAGAGGGHLRLRTENRVLRETIKSRQGFGKPRRAARRWRSLTAFIRRRDKLASGADSGRKRHRPRSCLPKSIHLAGMFRKSRSFR